MNKSKYITLPECVKNLSEILEKINLSIEIMDKSYNPGAHLERELESIQYAIENRLDNLATEYVILVDMYSCKSRLAKTKPDCCITGEVIEDLKNAREPISKYFEYVNYPVKIQEECFSIVVNGLHEEEQQWK